MTGYPDFNFPAFEDATQRLRTFGYQVVSPHELTVDGTAAGAQSWETYLRHDIIHMMQSADAVATLRQRDGFPPSRGMRIECDLARALAWQVRPVEEWLRVMWFPEPRTQPDAVSA